MRVTGSIGSRFGLGEIDDGFVPGQRGVSTEGRYPYTNMEAAKMEEETNLFSDSAISEGILSQIEERTCDATITQISTAISIMQYHLEKEARNRQVAMISPEDLCPDQKRDMIRDLAKLFRK